MVDIMLKLHCHCTTMDNFLFLWNSVEKQEYLIAVQVPFQTCLKLDVCLVINKILPFHNSAQIAFIEYCNEHYIIRHSSAFLIAVIQWCVWILWSCT